MGLLDSKATDGTEQTSMKQTGEDMNSIYKETSEGGLAIHVPVTHPAC
ncbi:MAG: hypothetical protein K2Y01_05695 [Rhabdochlamydiaceae bacterium]|nr:hypothetical protein [Rhabdochlamydiaceae bacterium]